MMKEYFEMLNATLENMVNDYNYYHKRMSQEPDDSPLAKRFAIKAATLRTHIDNLNHALGSEYSLEMIDGIVYYSKEA